MTSQIAADQAPRRWRARRRRMRVAHGAVLAVILLSWELAVTTGMVEQFIASRPSRVAALMWELLTEAATWSAVRVTVTEVFVGLLLGGGVGIGCALAVARIRAVRSALDPLVLAFYTLPRLALVPLFLVWFGLGMGSKIAVAFIHGFVLFLLGTYGAMDSIPKEYESSFLVMGGNRAGLVREVYLPFALPHLITAFRQALGLGLGSVVVAELIGSFEGIGFEMGLRLAMFDMTGTLAWVFIAAFLALGVDVFVRVVERRAFRWQ